MKILKVIAISIIALFVSASSFFAVYSQLTAEEETEIILQEGCEYRFFGNQLIHEHDCSNSIHRNHINNK